MPRRAVVRRATPSRFALVAIVAAAIGCTGENLFTGPSSGGSQLGPTVEVTAPGAGAIIALGDSVQVSANIVSSTGVSQVTFSGTFTNGVTAFISEVVVLQSAQDTTISRFLRQAAGTNGSARILVQARDIVGRIGADTVLVTIGS
jgi:hypothetical protein